ncbi:hypothetical protein B0H13DRAFT_1985587 [Mycena leptocephala]|nr:hypothetical protein B0H13DRAFT_1985587 [Mycena leptocephala]
MAIFVEGIPVTSVSFAPTARTVVSSSFFRTLARDSSHLLLTTPIHPHGSCSTVISCTVSATSGFDVVLGTDWSGLLREYLVSVGHRPPSPFNPLEFLLSHHCKSPHIPLSVIHTSFFQHQLGKMYRPLRLLRTNLSPRHPMQRAYLTRLLRTMQFTVRHFSAEGEMYCLLVNVQGNQLAVRGLPVQRLKSCLLANVQVKAKNSVAPRLME